MTQEQIYQTIAKRTGGDIYIGVVGPVRSGKSSFIKRFAELMLLPHIQSEALRSRANDELPQSAAGRTIMTTEPKFIPEQAVEIELKGAGISAHGSLTVSAIWWRGRWAMRKTVRRALSKAPGTIRPCRLTLRPKQALAA